MNFTFQYSSKRSTVFIVITIILFGVINYCIFKKMSHNNGTMENQPEQAIETDQEVFYNRFPSKEEYSKYREEALVMNHNFKDHFDFLERYGDFIVQKEYEDELAIPLVKMYLLMMMNKYNDVIKMIEERVVEKMRSDSLDEFERENYYVLSLASSIFFIKMQNYERALEMTFYADKISTDDFRSKFAIKNIQLCIYLLQNQIDLAMNELKYCTDKYNEFKGNLYQNSALMATLLHYIEKHKRIIQREYRYRLTEGERAFEYPYIDGNQISIRLDFSVDVIDEDNRVVFVNTVGF